MLGAGHGLQGLWCADLGLQVLHFGAACADVGLCGDSICKFWGSGCRFWGSELWGFLLQGFGVAGAKFCGARCGIWGISCWFWGAGYQGCQVLGFQLQRLEVPGANFGFQLPDFGFPGASCWALPGLGSPAVRFCGAGCRFWGARCHVLHMQIFGCKVPFRASARHLWGFQMPLFGVLDVGFLGFQFPAFGVGPRSMFRDSKLPDYGAPVARIWV